MSKFSVFISHRNRPLSNMAGDRLKADLEAVGIDTFFDKQDLQGGDTWDEKLINEVRLRDVLVLLIEEETDSRWVQREVDTARGASVSILPLVVTDSPDSQGAITTILENFQISDKQYISYIPPIKPAYMKDLIQRIRELSEITRNNQKDWLRTKEDRNKLDFIPETNERVRSLRLEGINCEFVITSGDATLYSGFDVLVNSENNFMQMARFYERDTLSRAIRYRGALRDGKRVKSDYMQLELNKMVESNYEFIPVTETDVIVTDAGHEDSELRENYRYVFHAAAVKFDAERRQPRSIDSESMVDLVDNCLEKVRLFNKENPDDPIKSIVFPVFGTGNAKGGYLKAVKAILTGFKKNLPRCERRGLKLEKIGLCIYNVNQTEQVFDIMNEMNFR